MRLYLIVQILSVLSVIEVSCFCGQGVPVGDSSTINGTGAEAEIFPWHVIIYDKSWSGSNVLECAGTLIRSDVIVSAARCFYDEILSPTINTSNYKVAAGKHYRLNGLPEEYLQESNVKSIVLAKEFQGLIGFFADDIALVILEHPFNLTTWVKPICVDINKELDKEELDTWQIGKAMGWGKMTNGYAGYKLQRMNLTFVPHDECISIVPESSRSFLTDDKFCASYTDGSYLDRWDQGGGIYFHRHDHWYLYGVVSITSFLENSSRIRYPVLFTKIGRIVDEINSNAAIKQCGIARLIADPLIVNGFRAESGEFPWQIAIYRKNSTEFHVQICAGTLISSKVVISAAHCFYDDNRKQKKDARHFVLAAGKYHRPYHWPEKYAQYSDIESIHLSRSYLGPEANYQGDISWLIVQRPFNLTPFVTPACLDFSNLLDPEQHLLGQIGKVAGWGITEDGNQSGELLQMNVPFVPHEKCISKLPSVFRGYYTIDKFCAGYLNGTSVCNGDSGGGLVFQRDGRWYLRGVVSLSPWKKQLCDPNQYATFTNVGFFPVEMRKFTNITDYDLI